jgi:predicted nucleic acid-binding protein
MNTSALNRPFDDLSVERVRLEAEAVAALLAAFESGRAALITSEYLEFEVGQIPDPERAHRVRTLLDAAVLRVRISAAVAGRALELEATGLRGLDALHVAAAEAGHADLLVTTDDRMIRRAGRADTALRVLRPTESLDVLRKEVK